MSVHVFCDESKASGFRLAAAAVLPAGLAGLRSTVSALRLPARLPGRKPSRSAGPDTESRSNSERRAPQSLREGGELKPQQHAPGAAAGPERVSTSTWAALATGEQVPTRSTKAQEVFKADLERSRAFQTAGQVPSGSAAGAEGGIPQRYRRPGSPPFSRGLHQGWQFPDVADHQGTAGQLLAKAQPGWPH